MKLGDLDALKKALDEQMNFDENCRDSVFDIIDNAPTVNDCPNCEYKKEADYIRSSSSYKELTELRKFKEEYKNSQGNCCNCELKAIQYSLGFQDGFLAAKEQFEKCKEAKDEQKSV